jgi:hypothetical protein
MRVSLATTGLIALLLAGCGRAPEDQPPGAERDPAAATTTDSASNMSANQEERAPAALSGSRDPLAPGLQPIVRDVPTPPDISPEAAPDVAFGYRYSFGLAADQIAPVQQRHARLCEELGPERCKVTGMTYRRSNEDDVRAELSLALEPGLAHRFGERALDGVREAEGKLVDSQVTGTDVGTGIRASTRTIAQLEEQLAELETRIAAGGSIGTLRDLRAEAEALRGQIRSLRGTRGEARERLANTPMTLSYASGAYVSGKPDFGGALATAWEQAKWLAYGLFTILMVLLPWLVLGGLVWLAVRARRLRRAREAGAATAG